MKISQLTSHDFSALDTLMKRNSKTLGFLPGEAILDYLGKGDVLGAKAENGQLMGYLLYGNYPDRFRISQLCVSEDFRGQGIAGNLIAHLRETATSQKSMRLHCRRDFPAHHIWPKLGFIPLDEKPGRSSAGHLLTSWYLPLAPDDQLELFKAKTAEDALDVVIDAQIFFDFGEPDSDKTKPSKSLLSDFLIDSLNLWITDELFNEIDRHSDPDRRKKSRGRARDFFRIVEYDSHRVEHFSEILRTLLPGTTESNESDIRHLAKTSASDVKTFVTRDRNLLKKSREILRLTGLEVVDPVALITRLHELSERQLYTSIHVSDVNLTWRRLASTDLGSFPFDSFLNRRERKGKFKEKLDSFLASPNRYRCDLLRAGEEIFALRVLQINLNRTINVPLARLSHSTDDRPLFRRFLIADIIFKAIEKNLNMVKIESSSLPTNLIPDLFEVGFTKCNKDYVRFCFSQHLKHEQVLSEITKLSPESANIYRRMLPLELEQSCSPLSLETTNQNYFLIPIHPGYAMNLVDRHQSEHDLFGGKTNILLRWDNVYYRSKTHHKVLKPPARLLWYVTQGKKGIDGRQIVAISHLDKVEIDTPKELFKKFKKYGILEWNDIYKMCDMDPSKNIMALKFSHTFPFRKPISLDTLRIAYKEGELGLSLQSPSRMSIQTFCKIFQAGYANEL